MLPTYENLKMLTSNGTSDLAVEDISNNTGIERARVQLMVDKGCAWLESQAAQLKAQPQSAKRDAILCAARGAWLVAKARGIL